MESQQTGADIIYLGVPLHCIPDVDVNELKVPPIYTGG